MSKEKMILQCIADGKSQRAIAKILKVSRNTVSSVTAASIRSGKSLEELLQMEEPEIIKLLFPEKELIPVQVIPDFEWVHKELLKDGITLHSLWDEYCDQCREAKKPPYMYSQFCKLYSDYVDQHRLTMHISHKPGDKLMVDWAGTTFSYYDADDDKDQKCYLFVATLPFSMLCYAEAFTNMKQEAWTNAHVHMYAYFGGSTKLLVCDNLKTGVIKNKKHEDPVFNKSYEELADHYNTALLPARILTPKDKAAVEGSVGALTRRLASKFRNKRFFSLHELNKAIRKELDEFNNKPFQKKEGSRFSVYTEEELPFMKPLPGYAYEYATWKVATVQMNYHISFDKQNYSVPYAYVRKKVDVRSTNSVVEIYYQGTRICSHRRLHGRMGQYATNIDHMPENHQLYSEWDSRRFKHWAKTIGPHTKEVVDKMFAAYQYRKHAESPELYAAMTFDEEFSLLVDAEFDSRTNNKIKRLLRNSCIPDTTAHIGGIEFLPERHLNQDLFSTLQTNEYISKGLNIMLIGATGCGKTYISCALATNACRHEYRVRYFRLNEFFGTMEAARIQGIYNETINHFRRIPLMIFDDFLLLPTTQDEQRDLLILLRARDEDKTSTILCSQIAVAGWHERLGSGGVADTLLDRITANGHEINIDGEVSMRLRHSRI